MAKTPLKTLKSKEFRYTYLVYGSTYIANNTVDSLCKIYHKNDVIPKLFGVTLINTITSLMKDNVFANSFGVSKAARVSNMILLVWLFRDVLTMAGAFVVPPRLGKLFEKQGMEEDNARKTAQMLSPILFQLFLTPVHLLGFDMHNFPKHTVMQRAKDIAKVYPSTCSIRMVRMGSAYGIGGVNNINFRNGFISRYEGEDWNNNY